MMIKKLRPAVMILMLFIAAVICIPAQAEENGSTGLKGCEDPFYQ